MQQALFDFRRDLVEAKRLILMLMARRDELLQIWMKHLEAKEVIKMLDKMCVGKVSFMCCICVILCYFV